MGVSSVPFSSLLFDHIIWEVKIGLRSPRRLASKNWIEFCGGKCGCYSCVNHRVVEQKGLKYFWYRLKDLKRIFVIYTHTCCNWGIVFGRWSEDVSRQQWRKGSSKKKSTGLIGFLFFFQGGKFVFRGKERGKGRNIFRAESQRLLRPLSCLVSLVSFRHFIPFFSCVFSLLFIIVVVWLEGRRVDKKLY